MYKMKKKTWKIVRLGSILLGLSGVISRLLGMVRDMVFAHQFGLGQSGTLYALDAYYVAFRLPDLLYTLLIAGSMSAAFIPLYLQIGKKSEENASLFASRVLHLILMLLLLMSVILYFLAPQLVPLLAPGLSEVDLNLSVQLTRIMLISPFFLGLSALFQGVENAHKRFWGMSLAPIVYNLSIIVGALYFGEEFGVVALAWSVVIGALLHFLVQVPGVLKTPFKYRFNFDFKGPELKQFIRLTLPRLFGLSAAQMGLFVDTILASLISVGSISIYHYALNLQSLPYGIVGISFSVAVFASMAERAENKEAFSSLLKSSLHTLLYWLLPACTGLFLLREEIVNLVFLRGSFDAAAAAQTSLLLGFFVWAALGQGLIALLARAFYAKNETKIPVFYAFVSILIAVGMNLFLVLYLNAPLWALGLSASVAALIQSILLFFALARFVKEAPGHLFPSSTFLKMLVALALMLGVVLSLKSFIEVELLLVLSSALLGAVVYIGSLKLMKINPSLRES